MPWLMWHGRQAEVIDLGEFRNSRRRVPPLPPLTVAEVDVLLRRVMHHLHPHWTEDQYIAWLQDEEAEDDETA